MTLVRTIPLVVLMLAACATGTIERCPPDQRPAVLDTLYFGTATPVGVVTEEEWRRFLAEEVTPRFPEGLTFWSMAGDTSSVEHSTPTTRRRLPTGCAVTSRSP